MHAYDFAGILHVGSEHTEREHHMYLNSFSHSSRHYCSSVTKYSPKEDVQMVLLLRNCNAQVYLHVNNS